MFMDKKDAHNQPKKQNSKPTEQDTPTIKPAPILDFSESIKSDQPESNRRNLIILIGGTLLVAIICVFAYFFFTEQWIFAPKGDDRSQTEPIATDPIFTSDDYPAWDGSTATQPLLLAFYRDFTGNTTAKLSDFDLTKTHEAITRVIDKKIDLAITTRPSEDEIAQARAAGVELEITPVVNEGFVFFVSTENPVDSLTITQIQDIYQGKITNWKEVGGEDLAIIPFQRPANSGSQTGMQELVMQGKPLMAPKTEKIVIGNMAGIVGMVSSYSNAPNAIGYSYFYYVTTMYQDIDQDVADGIKLLAIDGIAPKEATISDRTYPFTTSYYIVTRKDDANEQTQKLIDAMLSPRGQAVARGANYVPIQ